MKRFFLSCLLFSLIGCSDTPVLVDTDIKVDIDSTTYQSKGKNQRINFIILHYTAVNDAISIRGLTNTNVSSHYLVTTNSDDPVYSLVPDIERAWHAGVSNFKNYSNLNNNSIGIEIVNLGYDTSRKYGIKHGDPNNLRPKDFFYPYTRKQIEKIALLVKDLKNKYNIKDNFILGHSDIAPLRKQDPGPLFPWKDLYEQYAIGAWYEESDKDFFFDQKLFSAESKENIISEFKKYGYFLYPDISDLDFSKVIYAFQCHFRPEKVDGILDLETYAILRALNKKYSTSKE